MLRRGAATVGVGIVLAWRSVVLASQPELVWQNGFESADSCAWTHSEPPATCDPEMVFVPAGDFSMGSASGSEVETPVHSVSLSAYWIDRWEVTVAIAHLPRQRRRAALQPDLTLSSPATPAGTRRASRTR